jgi:glucosamine 6-phosphate synthetase-like amidotransferase/phosphosugar isomerase protein
MCGLFGYSCYGDDVKANYFNDIINYLARSSSERGTDAIGIAYLLDNKIEIEKDSKPAYDMNFTVPDETKVVLGHTRKSTQGSEKRIYNNHPFFGKTNQVSFALAHNGIISNDVILRNSLKLPKSKVETDSYIAVQLLENKGSVNMESLKFMAESVSGSFSFTVLDDQSNLYLVKGDSPLSILHFKDLKLYIYASTDRILWKAIISSPLFEKLKQAIYIGQSIEEIKVNAGQILKLSTDGNIEYGTFKYSDLYGFDREWYGFRSKKNAACEGEDEDYIDCLKQTAIYLGYSDDVVDELLAEGLSPMEIEDYLYDPELFQEEFEVICDNQR